MNGKVLTQGASAHRQHRVVKRTIKGFCHSLYPIERPRLGNESPGAIDARIEHAFGDIQMGQGKAVAPYAAKLAEACVAWDMK